MPLLIKPYFEKSPRFTLGMDDIRKNIKGFASLLKLDKSCQLRTTLVVLLTANCSPLNSLGTNSLGKYGNIDLLSKDESSTWIQWLNGYLFLLIPLTTFAHLLTTHAFEFVSYVSNTVPKFGFTMPSSHADVYTTHSLHPRASVVGCRGTEPDIFRSLQSVTQPR